MLLFLLGCFLASAKDFVELDPRNFPDTIPVDTSFDLRDFAALIDDFFLCADKERCWQIVGAHQSVCGTQPNRGRLLLRLCRSAFHRRIAAQV